MDPSYTIKLIKTLENLTFFPQQAIVHQLNERSLFLVSLFSEKWQQFVNNYCGMRVGCLWEIIFSENVLMIYLKFEDAKKNFQIGFKEDPNSSEDFYSEHDRRLNSTTLHFKAAHQLEKFSFKAIELLSHFFPPTSYYRITVPLGPRCPDFLFRFLAQLPFGTARYVDLQADQEVECTDLMTFLRRVRIYCAVVWVESRLSINLRMKNVVPCDGVLIHGAALTIEDARFMTQESLRRFDTCSAEIGENNFTSQDFNAFFRAWTRGEKRYKLENISFAIREDQKIDMEEVLKGLRVNVGEERLRDRWYFQIPKELDGPLHPKVIDCGQCPIIFSRNGRIGVILLEPNRMSFYDILTAYSSSMYTFLIDDMIRSNTDEMRMAEFHFVELERTVAELGANASPEDLEQFLFYSDKVEALSMQLREAREIKEKLETLWKND